MTMKTEQEYWDKAAEDPNVAENFIADADLNYCMRQIQPDVHFGYVLEIGCGIGRLTTELAARSDRYKVYGTDISSKMLDLAPKSSVKYRTGDGRQLPYPDEMFDTVYSMLVFQHIPDSAKAAYIKEAYRVLKTGGNFIVQFVEGDYHADIDHNTSLENMLFWLEDNGFVVSWSKRDMQRKEWLWLMGVKR